MAAEGDLSVVLGYWQCSGWGRGEIGLMNPERIVVGGRRTGRLGGLVWGMPGAEARGWWRCCEGRGSLIENLELTGAGCRQINIGRSLDVGTIIVIGGDAVTLRRWCSCICQRGGWCGGFFGGMIK